MMRGRISWYEGSHASREFLHFALYCLTLSALSVVLRSLHISLLLNSVPSFPFPALPRNTHFSYDCSHVPA
jgi:hypothetical protein